MLRKCKALINRGRHSGAGARTKIKKGKAAGADVEQDIGTTWDKLRKNRGMTRHKSIRRKREKCRSRTCWGHGARAGGSPAVAPPLLLLLLLQLAAVGR